MGWLSDIGDGISGAWDATTGAVSDAAGAVGGAVSDAGSWVGHAATSVYDEGVSLANTAGDYIHRGEQAVTDGVHWVEDEVDHGSHALANMVSDVPVLGTLANAAADTVTFGTQVAGGVVGGATSLVGGVANAVVHPLDTARGLETMAEHLPVVGAPLRLGHNMLNVATGDESFGTAMDRSFNPITQMQEDGKYWGNVGSALIEPYKQSIKEGRYGEVAGRGAFDIAMLLSGAGEVEGAGAAGKLAEGADAARLAEGADAARLAEGADGARLAEGADAAKATETETKMMGASKRNTTPLTESEQASLRARAEKLGMPADDIKLNPGDPGGRTSWGQMFGKEQLEIADDVKPAIPTPDAAGKYPSLSANQRVSENGALAHEVVGHREADLAGASQTKSYAEYSAMSEEDKAAAQLADGARDEAQASLRAAKFAPDLSNSERMILFKDAMERLAKIGLGVDDVPGLGLHLGKR